jgi:hypothetical protein
MKNKVFLVVILLMMFYLYIGYAETGETFSTLINLNNQTLAEQVISALLIGNYSDVVINFNPEMKKYLSVSALKIVWEDINTVAGDFIGFSDTKHLSHDVYNIYDVTTQHRNEGITSRVVFDSDGQIAGLFFSFTK